MVIDLSVFLAVLVSMGVLFLVGRFLWEKYAQVLWLGDQRYLVRCSLCTHQFFVYRKDNVGVCPRCEHLVSLDSKSGDEE